MAERDEKVAGKRRAQGSGSGMAGDATRRVRSLVATIVWLAAVVAALVLAVGALLIALGFNRDNAIVSFVTDLAQKIDFGVLKDFKPDKPNAEARQDALTKSVLVNWGVAAVIYLVGGKVIERVVRPGS